jgi:hypothetical protein
VVTYLNALELPLFLEKNILLLEGCLVNLLDVVDLLLVEEILGLEGHRVTRLIACK